jgi:hypothetical protein
MDTCHLAMTSILSTHGYMSSERRHLRMDTWLHLEDFLKFYLEPLTSFGQTLLKQVRDRRQTSLLGLLQDGVAQRIQGARGLAVGV